MRVALLTILTCSCLLTHVFAQPYRNEWIDYSKTYYKFPIVENKLFRISKAVLTNAGLGNVNAEDFQMWRNGEEVSIYTTETTGPLAANGFIEFMGKRNDGMPDTELYDSAQSQVNYDYSYFSDTSWYYLTINPGKPNKRILAAINNATTTTLRPDSFYMHELRTYSFYTWNYGAAYRLPGPEADDGGYPPTQPVYGSVVEAGEGWAAPPFNKDYPRLTGLSNLQVYPNGPPMQFSYSASGNYSVTRSIEVSMNDSIITLSSPISGFTSIRDTINNIPLSRISNDGVVFKFSSTNTFYWENDYLNVFALRYPHKFNFQNSAYAELSLEPNTNGNYLKIGAFRNDNVATILYDLTNAKRYVGIIKADSSFYGLGASATKRKIVIANQVSNLGQVNILTVKNFKSFASADMQGDFIIITNKILTKGASPDNIEAYRAYRSSVEGGGYTAKIYDIDELAEQFAFGQRKHPLAIRNFIKFSLEKFTTKPKFIFLIGRGTQYEAIRGLGSNTVIEQLGGVPTFGTPASDNLLASANNLDPTPLVPIGRLSAIANEEVGTYLDKVKKYEALRKSAGANAGQKDWQKEVLQLVGGDDAFLTSVIETGFMVGYRNSITPPPVGALVHLYRRVNNPNFAADMDVISNRIDSGAGIITYFGHSSSSSIDFNLDNPEEYTNTDGKFPIFMANGCRAGNIFDFNTYRLYSKNQSISENFIFAKNKGAISYISNSSLGVLNYMHLFTRFWHQALGSSAFYNKSLGEIHKEAIRNCMATVGADDAFNRINLQQAVLHSDPAITPFPYAYPDYTTSETQISLKPVDPNAATDSVWVTARFSNIARAVSDTVEVEIAREFPDGSRKTLLTKKIINLYKSDSVSVKMGLKGLFETGTNYIVATIDPANKKQEESKSNNSGKLAFSLNTNAIIPVFPYDLSIINYPSVQLTASTVNPVAKAAPYRLQLDTTKLFNSPALFTKDTLSVGGAIVFQPGIAWKNNTVYYWRVTPLTAGIPVNWSGASFLYNSSLENGFNQSHYFQHKQSTYDKFELDSNTRRFEFGNRLQNIYISHGIYNTSGTENTHFSVVVNGQRLIQSACIGQSIIFNVFDSLSFVPWSNYNQRFGSGYYCGQYREYNFEFKYFSSANRKLIMDFLDSIPKGNYVVARLVLDAPQDSSFAQYWKRDTLIFGKNKSLYHSLVKQGFYDLDSLNRPRTFGFVFKKDDTLSFKPFHRFSEGVYDRLNTSVNVTTRDSVGALSSPLFGPSKEWKSLFWDNSLHPGTTSPPISALNLYGRDVAGNAVLLNTFQPDNKLIDVSSINAAQYPMLQLQMKTREPIFSKPLQLDYWRLTYLPVADGALSARDYFNWKGDTITAIIDTLQFGIAFKNVSRYNLDSVDYKVSLGNKSGNETIIKSGKIKSLNATDTAIIRTAALTNLLQGKCYLKVEVNDLRKPVEQTYFNNIAYLPFYVDTLKDPVTLLSFNASPLNNSINTTWSVMNEIKVQKYDVEYSKDSLNWLAINSQTAFNAGAKTQDYFYKHPSPTLGNNYYRLSTTDIYGNKTYSRVINIPIKLLAYDAKPVTGSVSNTWKFLNEIRIARYEIEYGTDSTQAKVVSSQAAANTGLGEFNYSYLHTGPSFGKNYYRLTVKDSSGNIIRTSFQSIPVSLTNFSAAINGKSVVTNWSILNEINIAGYTIETATDSTKMKSLTTITATNKGAGTADYTFTHASPTPGYNYYRLKGVDKNGNVVYSAIQKVYVGDPAVIIIYPNPFNSFVRIVTADNSTTWQLRLFEVKGQLIMSKSGIGTVEIPTGTLPKGIYFLQYKKGDNTMTEKLEKH